MGAANVFTFLNKPNKALFKMILFLFWIRGTQGRDQDNQDVLSKDAGGEHYSSHHRGSDGHDTLS